MVRIEALELMGGNTMRMRRTSWRVIALCAGTIAVAVTPAAQHLPGLPPSGNIVVTGNAVTTETPMVYTPMGGESTWETTVYGDWDSVYGWLLADAESGDPADSIVAWKWECSSMTSSPKYGVSVNFTAKDEPQTGTYAYLYLDDTGYWYNDGGFLEGNKVTLCVVRPSKEITILDSEPGCPGPGQDAGWTIGFHKRYRGKLKHYSDNPPDNVSDWSHCSVREVEGSYMNVVDDCLLLPGTTGGDPLAVDGDNVWRFDHVAFCYFEDYEVTPSGCWSWWNLQWQIWAGGEWVNYHKPFYTYHNTSNMVSTMDGSRQSDDYP